MCRCLLMVFFVLLFPVQHTYAQKQVFMTQTDQTVTLWNSKTEVIFNKKKSNITYIKNSISDNLLGKGKAYLNGPDFGMSDCTFKIVRQQPDLIELSFYHEGDDHFTYELHYVLRAGVAGVYCFLIQSHVKGTPDAEYGQTRWGITADNALFDYHLVSDKHQGPMPKIFDLHDEVQDWTFRLPDSSYYTKYDYADYIEDNHVHGMAGVRSGYGMFAIQASHEYLLGGPTKQFQNVHAGPFLINMFNDGHFLWDGKPDDGIITGDWKKLSGPFLLYVNMGKDVKAIWADAKKQADIEVAQWPYSWMNNPEYPLERGTVTGTLQFKNGEKAKLAHVVLAAPNIDWQAQSKGYMFYAKADDNGNFILKNIRPGTYTLYAYGCDVTDEFSKANVVVTADKSTDLEMLLWPTNNYKKLWQIGVADRFTDGFKLSDHPRYYDVFMHVPADLDYTIGKSTPAADWYYAQTQSGSWNVIFDVNETYKGQGVITVGIAGSSKSPQYQVWLNDKMLGKYYFGNDHGIYRSAIRGSYYQKLEVRFPAELLRQGENRISFKTPHVKHGGGIMYDVVKLELDNVTR